MKGILFIVLLTTIALVISGCSYIENVKPQLSKAPYSEIQAPVNAQSAGSVIECYSDDDCPETTNRYCNGNDACISHISYICENPGTSNSDCVESAGGAGCHTCDYGCENGYCTSLDITYMDPTSCEAKVILNDSYNNSNSIGIHCDEHTEFVGMVTHVECVNPNDLFKVVYTSWYQNTLPHEIGYTCVDQDYGWYAPYLLIGYCCDIKNVPTTRGILHTTRLNEDGTVTQT